MIEQDLIETIIALPTDLFYNTNIGIYIFILSKEGTKRKERKGKIQLINATSEEFWTQLRKSLGKKRKEISPKQIEKIVRLYADFKENKYSKIFDKEEFLYREYRKRIASKREETNQVDVLFELIINKSVKSSPFRMCN